MSDITNDFVEHTHPQYGGGYFCTPDVFERIASLSHPATQAGALQAVQPVEAGRDHGRERLHALYYAAHANQRTATPEYASALKEKWIERVLDAAGESIRTSALAATQPSAAPGDAPFEPAFLDTGKLRASDLHRIWKSATPHGSGDAALRWHIAQFAHAVQTEAAPSTAIAAREQDGEVWLIEDQDHFPRHRWLRIVEETKRAYLSWTEDANVATHFARREDAVNFQKLHGDFCALSIVTGHAFLDMPATLASREQFKEVQPDGSITAVDPEDIAAREQEAPPQTLEEALYKISRLHDALAINNNTIESRGRRIEELKAALASRPEAPAAPSAEAVQWPLARDIGRIADMSPRAFMRVGFDGDNDVSVGVYDEQGSAVVEFCTPGSGGGKSSRTRRALIALMVAMEADNVEDPSRDWWARRASNPQSPDAAALAGMQPVEGSEG